MRVVWLLGLFAATAFAEKVEFAIGMEYDFRLTGSDNEFQTTIEKPASNTATFRAKRLHLGIGRSLGPKTEFRIGFDLERSETQS